MKRTLLRILVVAAAVLVVAAVFVRGGKRMSLESVLDVSRLSEQALPELLQRIRDFHRVVTRDGKKLLEVSAHEASYFRDDRAIEILQPTVTFYDEGVEVGSISGASGWLMIEGNEIEAVSLRGGVQLTLTKFEVSAEQITYERATDIITTEGPTEVRSPEILLAGKNLTFDLGRKSLIVNSHVDMTLRSTPQAVSNAQIKPRNGGAS